MNLSKRSAAASLLALALVTAGGWGTSGVRAAADVLAVPVSEAFDACVLKCEDASICPAEEHWAWEGSPKEWQEGDGTHDGCEPGLCVDAHGDGGSNGCEISANPLLVTDVEALRTAIVRADVDALRLFLEEHPEELQFNAARSAVQILTCTGAVVAHMPVSAAMSAALPLPR